MITFIDTIHCQQRRACKDCRSSQRFRDSVRAVYAVPEDFDQRCPLETAPGVIPLPMVKPLPPPPPPGQLLVNFAKAVGGRAKATLAGEPVNVSDEVFRQRVAICETCVLLMLPQRRCRHPKCGCWVDRKARWATEECPENCWKDPAQVQVLRERYAAPEALPAPPVDPPPRKGCCGGRKT